MAIKIAKAFRLPQDVVRVLDAQPKATEYVVEAIREKAEREQQQAIEASLQCLAFEGEENDISDFQDAQKRVMDLDD
jgi:hypothetical protein